MATLLAIALACAMAVSLVAPPGARAEALSPALTTIHLDRHVLRPMGVEVVASPGALRVRDAWTHSYSVVTPSRLELAGRDERASDFRRGFLVHEGGPLLRLPDGELALENFELRVVEAPFVFDLLDAAGRRWFLLDYLHLMRAPREPVYRLRNLDLSIAPELAERLGHPELAGAYAGRVEVDLPSRYVAAAEGEPGLVAASEAAVAEACVPNFDPELAVDVALIRLGAPSPATAPEASGRVAMGFEARLRNVGTADIPWFRSIEPDGKDGSRKVGPHPYLVLHFYRVAGGVLTQLGRSDVKHAFFATNYECSCDGGQALFEGCEDVYGTNTNMRQVYFAPREEVGAFSGAWQLRGSHFDGDPVDEYRDHWEEEDHPDPFEHRLVVTEQGLSTPGAEYFIEGWYLAAGDVDIFNSMGHRKVTPTHGNGMWTFPLADAGLVSGSILDVVVDPAAEDASRSNRLLDTGRGRLQLVSTTRPGGEGRVHYEYALMNFDFDGQIRRFAVPVAPELELAAVGFSGFGPGPSPDWTPSREAGALVWTAPEGASLDWGSLVGFRFEADAGPVASLAGLDALESLPGEVLAIAMRGPTPAPEPAAGPLGLAALLCLAALRRRAMGQTRASCSGLASPGAAHSR